MENIQQLQKKSKRAVLWNFIGKISKQLVTFIVSLFLARLLSPEDFGTLGMATAFIAITTIFSDFGLASAIIQAKDPTKEQISTVFYINLGISIVLMISIILCSGYIADYYHNAEVGPIVKFISYTLIIYALNGVQRALLVKELKMRVLTFADLFASIINGSVGITLAYLDFGVWSIVYGAFASSIFITIYIWYYSTWKPQLLFRLSSIKSLFNVGYKMFISYFVNAIYSQLDVLLIGRFFSSRDLGFYYRAKSLNNLVIKYASQSFETVYLSTFSKLQDQLHELRIITIKLINILSFFLFLIIGLLYLNVNQIIIILFSAKWLPSVAYFKIIVLGSFSTPISLILLNLLLGIGKAGTYLKLQMTEKISGIAILILSSHYGLIAMLWSAAIMTFLIMILQMYYVKKHLELPLKKQFTSVLYYLLFMILAGVLPTILTPMITQNLWLSLFVNSILFIMIYLPLNSIFNSIGYSFALRKFYFYFDKLKKNKYIAK